MRVARVLGVIVAAWFVFLLVAGAIYGARAGERVAVRLGESLQADARIESSSLALVRGHLEMRGIHARRDDLGVIALDVGRFRCDLLPLGGALFDRECRTLLIEDMTFEVSSAALLRVARPKKAPLHVGGVKIRNARFVLEASAIVPDLGKIEITIDEVDAGPTTFTTPLSWLFSMTSMRATLALPAGVTVQLAYLAGEVTATGSVLGSTPVTVALRVPRQSDLADAKAELAALAQVGRQLAEELVARRAKDWLKSKLPSL